MPWSIILNDPEHFTKALDSHFRVIQIEGIPLPLPSLYFAASLLETQEVIIKKGRLKNEHEM